MTEPEKVAEMRRYLRTVGYDVVPLPDTETVRSMREFRERYLPSTQRPHPWERSDTCARCGLPFADPIHQDHHPAFRGGDAT